MENNENFVTEEVTENTEQTAEENEKNAENQTEKPPKIYTEEEFNAKLDEVLGKKLARREAKLRREYEKKYAEKEAVQEDEAENDATNKPSDLSSDSYQDADSPLPKESVWSEEELEILAKAKAKEIIGSGFEKVVDEVDRLTSIGIPNMTAREKALFEALANYRQAIEISKKLSNLGISEDICKREDFLKFAIKFNPGTPPLDIYDIYAKTQQKEEPKTMGSMKNNTSDDGTVKDFYTREEALSFTKEDFDKNPALFSAVEQSMQKW